MFEDWTYYHSLKSIEDFFDSKEFEEVDSQIDSVDQGVIKSIYAPKNPEDTEEPEELVELGELEEGTDCDVKVKKQRSETCFEMIMNTAFNLEMWKEHLWLCDDSKKDKVYLLGNKYEPQKEEELQKMRTAFSQILWFSYRKNFPMLNYKEHPQSKSFISDTGWGCMIRVCQMMFAECLKRHCMANEACISGRQSSESSSQNIENLEKLNEKVISWFLDSELDAVQSPYSIQNLSYQLQNKFRLEPGKWLKPSSVLFALQEIHKSLEDPVASGLEMEICLESTLYITEALKKVTCLGMSSTFEKDFETVELTNSQESEPLSFEHVNEINSEPETDNQDENEDHSICQFRLECPKEIKQLLNYKWKKSLIIFMLAKIGLDKPSPQYIPFIKDLLSYPESVGMIGGKPGLAFYFVGYVEDKLIYLDPHYVQKSLSKEALKENMHTYTSSIKHIDFADIDTSVTFGFFIKDEESFRSFIDRFSLSCACPESFLGIGFEEPKENPEDVESVCDDYEDCQVLKDEDGFEKI